MPKKPEIFSDTWYKDDFLIPPTKEERVVLRLKMEGESCMGRMFMDGGEQRRAILLDRINMIETVDAPTPKKPFAVPVRSVFPCNEAGVVHEG